MNFLLLILHRRSIDRESKSRFQRELIYVFSTTTISNPDDSFIRTAQVEYFKLMFEDCQLDTFAKYDQKFNKTKTIGYSPTTMSYTDNSEFKNLFPRKEMLFILLDTKDQQLLKNLLQVFPDLINQLDDQGNDPLMYITLHVSGCRHRIIEMLIKKGCSSTQRQNSNGQTLRDILQLPRNRKQFTDLI